MDEKKYPPRSADFGLSGISFKSFSPRSFFKNVFCKKYIVLSFLSVILITALAVVILSSFARVNNKFDTALPAVASSDVSEELAPETCAGILPCATVFYHGEKIGEYKRDYSTVSDALRNLGVVLQENDVINYPKNEQIAWGMNINVDKVEWIEEVITEKIPFETIEIPSQTVPKGKREIKTEGVLGVSGKSITHKIVNGEEVPEENVEKDIYTAPVNEEVYVGVGGVFTSPDGAEYNYSYYIDVTATAYTHTGNLTYSGTVAEVGVIAVDPRYIELGSNVYVIGNYGDYGVCRAEDIGGGIKRYRIDVFLDTEEECVIFGRRNMRCYVLE